MNYNEALKFIESNTPEKLAEELVRLHYNIERLNSEIKGNNYWIRYYVGSLLSNPNLNHIDSSSLFKEAQNFVEAVNKELE